MSHRRYQVHCLHMYSIISYLFVCLFEIKIKKRRHFHLIPNIPFDCSFTNSFIHCPKLESIAGKKIDGWRDAYATVHGISLLAG